MVDINGLKLQAPKLNHRSREIMGQGSPIAIIPIKFNDYVDALLEIIKTEAAQEGYKFDLSTLEEEVSCVRDRAIDEITCLPLEHRWAACLRYKHALYNSIKHHRIASPFKDDDFESDEERRIRVPRSLLNKLQRLHAIMRVSWV